MKFIRLVPLIVLLAFTIVPPAAVQTFNAPGAQSLIPNYQVSNSLSLNWSGYAVNATGVTSATGTFTVPTVGPPGSVGGLPTDVSVWVGIDGYTTGTVEQTGVSGSYGPSGATYYAWWEMYPRSSVTIKSMTVSPGDVVNATVVSNGGGSFTLAIVDTTNGQSFITTVHAPVGGRNAAQLGSAEWVVERAATIYKGYLTILPLATFDSTTFTSASYAVNNGAPTTLQSAVGSLPQCTGVSPEASCYDQMTMVALDSGGNPYSLVSTSAVTSNSFTVSFLTNGTPYPIPGAIGHK